MKAISLRQPWAVTCRCVRCEACNGSGRLWRLFGGSEVHAHRVDDLEDPEDCEECGGTGVSETCSDCEFSEGIREAELWRVLR